MNDKSFVFCLAPTRLLLKVTLQKCHGQLIPATSMNSSNTNNAMSPSPNPVYIVTGASRGYGLAIVKELLLISPQAHILGTARSADKLAAVQAELGGADRFDYVAGDITDESVAKAIVDKAVARWGRIDGVVHNAGILDPMDHISKIPISFFRQILDVNVTSVLQLTQLALPHLRTSPLGLGRLVLISSGAATNAYHGWTAYCTSKAALNMLAKCLAVEEPKVVTVALRPGVLDTDMQQHIRDNGKGKLEDGTYEYFVKAHQEGSLVDPHVSGHVAAQLLVKAGKELSGQFVDWKGDEVKEFQKK
ncbi:putative short-chain dehydrogenase [Catenaria anguillulae PL171]|uniref:Putative short-chain dehydrogenase n=1 Tax=Catenaria anguillulae PL171 TaxID=765915 RepID=A0A1Y2HAU7_9FUNG|nr:putative short-chain dehydrogenase [Catenaria anguillulae PL171]